MAGHHENIEAKDLRRHASPGSWLMQEVPGPPKIGGPGRQFMIYADLLKLFPQLQRSL